MNSIYRTGLAAVLLGLLSMVFVGACSGPSGSGGEGPADDHSQGSHEDVVKGPHGGRLMEQGELAVELTIYETGVPPEYRAWVTRQGKPVPPDAVDLTVELTRLDGEKNVFAFTPAGDFLRGDGVVHEPHSFDSRVIVRVDSKPHEWTYRSYEGRVTIAADAAAAAGVRTETAGPRLIRDVIPLYGRIAPNPDATRTVSARFGGTVQSVRVSVGDRVQAGTSLASVESSDSLQVYAVTAPIAGVITERRINAGEQTGDAPLFVISDLGQLWVELSVFPRDVAHLRAGQSVRIHAVDGQLKGEAVIVKISPAGVSATQALQAWARLKHSGDWTAGRYVSAEVLVGGAEVPVAIKRSALQSFRDFTVAFENIADTYEVRMLDLGRSDGEYIEVLGGLKSGARYVADNSYLIKADIEKSGASHDH